MGLRASPAWAYRFYYLAEEFVRGDETNQDNPLLWDEVILNLLGNDDFNPAYPNVIKLDSVKRIIAGDIRAYVDDLRALGCSLEHAWAIARRIALRLQFLGIQDAPRKRKVDNGPWAGGVYHCSDTMVVKTVTETKWNKVKTYIAQLHDEIHTIGKDNIKFEYKRLEIIRGFLCHLAMTYDFLFPFLKGFHLTLSSHLPGRNHEGWKMKEAKWVAFCAEQNMSPNFDDYESTPPVHIKPVPRFFECINVLKSFFEIEIPPSITVRTTLVSFVIYGFADASKSDFWASLQMEKGVRYRIGAWSKDDDGESSNFREFENVVTTLEQQSKDGSINRTTLIMAIDNSTVEPVIFKGNSSSPKLFDLVVRFKRLELHSRSRFLVTHVSGERMKAQGTDGLSRGQLREGVSLGLAMNTFCPWGKSALQRSTDLKPWLQSWIGSDLEVLTPLPVVYQRT